MENLERFFNNPTTPSQRQYEAIRALAIDKLSVAEVSEKFGYSTSTIYSLMHDVKSEKIDLFPAPPKRGPKQRRTPPELRKEIIHLRKQRLSCRDIAAMIHEKGYKISNSTIENILADADFSKLPRRTNEQRGLTQKNQSLSSRATLIDFEKLEPFNIDCPVVGVYFFLPYIIESGILDIIKQCELPKSSAISAEQAALSMLLLKLMGNKRLSHMEAYNHEPGLGLFAGLSVLPKNTYMSTYSCRTSESLLMDFQQQLMQHFQTIYPQYYTSDYINLDFHSIPHFGTESQMERVWCGARSKAMKGANTLFAQDSESNAIIYTRADILRKDETNEILQFTKYWKSIKGDINETLVFDCKLTTYQVLDEIANQQIKFITLRKRTKKLLAETASIDEQQWKKIRLSIPKRKHKSCSVYESKIILPKCETAFRQIIVKDHGRAEPTFIITNHHELALKDVLEVYAKRWHIENKFAELVTFFNLNALSSPIMIRIHFDILWTIIADTLYHRFAQDLPRFQKCRADTIFREFVNMPGKISFDGESFTLKIRKRAHTPILKGINKLNESFTIPWLENKKMKIEWVA